MYNFLMKKSVDFLLILPLLLVIVFVVFVYQTGAMTDLFAIGTPVPTKVGTESATPTILSSVIPHSTSTISYTSTPTLTPVPSSTLTQTITPIPTLTDIPTPTNTATSTGTGTPVSQEINSGIETGNEIVRAIEHYYLDQGHYPAALNDLLPAYLPGLPVSSTGQPYFYRFFDPVHPMASEGYWLAFRVIEQENITCTYLRRLEYWDCNYASP
jgi:hypothetical protein